jgi:uncharacterized protein
VSRPVERPAGRTVEHTPDGRYVVLDGRRWRATDPALPEDVAAALRSSLMSARRAVGAALRAQDPTAERAARDRVQRAKEALGERGTPWWEQSDDERRARWEAGLDAPPSVTDQGPAAAAP